MANPRRFATTLATLSFALPLFARADETVDRREQEEPCGTRYVSSSRWPEPKEEDADCAGNPRESAIVREFDLAELESATERRRWSGILRRADDLTASWVLRRVASEGRTSVAFLGATAAAAPARSAQTAPPAAQLPASLKTPLSEPPALTNVSATAVPAWPSRGDLLFRTRAYLNARLSLALSRSHDELVRVEARSGPACAPGAWNRDCLGNMAATAWRYTLLGLQTYGTNLTSAEDRVRIKTLAMSTPIALIDTAPNLTHAAAAMHAAGYSTPSVKTAAVATLLVAASLPTPGLTGTAGAVVKAATSAERSALKPALGPAVSTTRTTVSGNSSAVAASSLAQAEFDAAAHAARIKRYRVLSEKLGVSPGQLRIGLYTRTQARVAVQRDGAWRVENVPFSLREVPRPTSAEQARAAAAVQKASLQLGIPEREVALIGYEGDKALVAVGADLRHVQLTN